MRLRDLSVVDRENGDGRTRPAYRYGGSVYGGGAYKHLLRVPRPVNRYIIAPTYPRLFMSGVVCVYPSERRNVSYAPLRGFLTGRYTPSFCVNASHKMNCSHTGG